MEGMRVFVKTQQPWKPMAVNEIYVELDVLMGVLTQVLSVPG
jgi:hypothetical protein